MFYIFIDTQAVEREAFGFNDSAGLLALANAVVDGHVTVLLTDVTDREIKSHIVERVTKALATVKAQYVLQVLDIVDFNQWRTLAPDAAAKNALEEWERYKTDIKPTLVSVDLAKPTQMMEAYFDLKPPFSPRKRTEFRDAFVLEALRVWAATENQQVIVVSGDAEMKTACDGERLVHAETIADALARTLDNEAMEKAAREALINDADLIEERLQQEIEGLPVSIDDDPDADIEGVSISKFKLEPADFELIEVRAGTVVLSGPVGVHVDVEATVADYDNGSRDEGDWAFLPYNSVTYSSDLNPRISVRIPIADQTPLALGAVEDVNVEEPHDLDVGYRWEAKVRKHWSEDEDPEH